MNRLDRPTLAKIEGSAVGGGLAIALACDLRFAAEDAHLAVPPANWDCSMARSRPGFLSNLVGPAAAKDLLFSARTVEPQEALRLGLINRCLPATALAEAADAQARTWSRLSQASIRGAKKAVRAALAANFDELRALVETAALGEDFREGRAAFKAKRLPQFPRGA